MGFWKSCAARSFLPVSLALTAPAWGSDVLPPLKTHQPVYQNPFDLASGGASLTRATQEGALFVNPSLPAFGRGLLRWIFLRTSLHAGADSVDLVRGIVQGGFSPSSLNSSELMNRALKTPVHVGLDLALGVMTAGIGIGGVFAGRVDIEGRQFGSVGLPELRLRDEVHAGPILTTSKSLGDHIAIGAAAKYLYEGEIRTILGIDAVSGGGDLQTLLKNSLHYGYGLALDLGVTTQLRTDFFDIRLAGTVTDVGNTKFSGGMDPWKQAYHGGLGLIFHGEGSSFHCAADLRDLSAVYGEHWTRRFYTGCKAILSRIVAVGGGYSQGWPTYGVVLNLLLMRLEAGSYTREFGSQAGVNGRRVYFVATGFEI